MSAQRMMVTLTALASMVLVGAGIGALRHAGVADVAAPSTTTTSVVDVSTSHTPPSSVRVEGASATRAPSIEDQLGTDDQLAAAQHQVAWLQLAIATATCERDLLRAQLDELRSPRATPAGVPATCSQP